MLLLAFIELTTPAMLGGLALLSLPVIAHLMNRQARRRIVFPTILLLRASAATQSRIFRLRRWILLLLRCLAVAMIAMAFARPIWLDAGAKNTASGEEVALLLLMDTSASTAQQTGGVSVLHELRAAALRALDALKIGTDKANIVYVSARPRSSFPVMSRNLPALRQELGQLSATYERGDFSQAVARAGELLAAHNGPRQLVVLSDLQQTNWQDLGRGRDIGERLPANTRVTVIDVKTAVPDNVALSAPRHFPTQPLIGQSTQLIVQAGNFSARTKQVRVTATIDKQSLPPQTITLNSGEQRDVAFDTVIEGTGAHEVAFNIPADGLEADNRAYSVVTARHQLPVVIVSDDNPDEPGTAAYFLTRALSPHLKGLANRYDIRHVSSLSLADTRLSDATAVFVGYVGELSPKAARTLVEFVRRGGGLLFFCGQGPVRRNLQTLQPAAGDAGSLPWIPIPARGFSLRDEAVRITGGKWRSRMLREFDEQSQFVISQIRFKKLWTPGAVAPQAEVLLTFSDETPALALCRVGSGQFLLANFSPALASSDLGKYGSFVALMQMLAKQLSPAADAHVENLVGGSYQHPKTYPLDTRHSGLQVMGPDGESVSVGRTVDADHVTLQIPRTTSPGFYRFMLADETIDSMAVNVDKRESDLTRMARELLLNQLAVGGTSPELQSSDDWRPIDDLRGRPLWGWFFVAALLAIGLELCCLLVWKR